MNVIQELHQFEDGLRLAQPSLAHAWDGVRWVVDVSAVAMLEKREVERLCAKVDAAADRARIVLAGDPLRAMEYAQAAADAQLFKDAGYPKKGVPLAVSAWVIKSRTAKQAADQIIAKAAQQHEALLTLRVLRLNAKEQIKAHALKDQIDLARNACEQAIAAIRQSVAWV